VKPLSAQTLYEILDVLPDANAAVIAEAVERAAALYAPGSLATYTLMAPEEEQLMARRLEEARITLLDPAARAGYDERLGAGDPSAAAPAGEAASSEVDPALRAAWPELPPASSAAAERGRDWGEEDEVELGDPAATPPPRAPAAPEHRPLPPVIPALAPAPPAAPALAVAPAPGPEEAPPEPPRAAELPPAAQAQAPSATPIPAAPAGLRPILLSREVPPSAAPPSPVAPVQHAASPATIPDGTAWSGEVLRRLREARGISLQQISERTKVTRHHIENIEGDRYEQLPASVYLRGILLSIARELRLDGQKVSRSYLERVTAAISVTAPVQRPR
jgi:hypothetical protein